MIPLRFSRKRRARSDLAKKSTEVRRQRALALECLEDRRLLALTDTGAISGTLFYDLPGPIQKPVAGETVQLYRDDGDAVFDINVDQFVGDDVTDVDGQYRFLRLTAGTYFLVQPPEPSGNIHPAPTPLVVPVVVTPADASGNAGVILDEFETYQLLSAAQPPLGTPLVVEGVSAPEAIGDHRRLVLESIQGSLPIFSGINVNSAGTFFYAEPPDTRGRVQLIWDGAGGSSTTVNPTGLGGIDVTGGGLYDSILSIVQESDQPAIEVITVYTDADHRSQVVLNVPIIQNFERLTFFSEFQAVPGFAPADFTNVGAIRIQVDKAPGIVGGLDYILEGIETIGPGVVEADLPYQVTSEIALVKLTNGTDNDEPTGPLLPVGSTVTWTFLVTNPGNEAIANVTVTDDQPGVNPAPVLSGSFNIGDLDQNNLLEPGEEWRFTASGTAVARQYANLGSVVGTGTVSEFLLNDENPDHYFGVDSSIAIEKRTNGEDADDPTGPLIAIGQTVIWFYEVNNPGNVPLANVTVVDDNGTPGNPLDDFFPTFLGGDTNNDGLLDPGETWIYLASGPAEPGQYSNLAIVTGVDPIGRIRTDDDPSNYFGVDSRIALQKLTNSEDANTPSGPLVAVGDTVTWTYLVTNPGNVPLANAILVDDSGTPLDPSDDFNPVFVTGDDNDDDLLDPGETWVYTFSGPALPGQYANVAIVTGVDAIGQMRTDDDPSHYFGVQRFRSRKRPTASMPTTPPVRWWPKAAP